jgi:hypothetical protein
MHLSTAEIIETDPQAFTVALQMPQGTAWWCQELRRYLVQHGKRRTQTWTNSMATVRQLIGGPEAGQQLDLFTEATTWSTP